MKHRPRVPDVIDSSRRWPVWLLAAYHGSFPGGLREPCSHRSLDLPDFFLFVCYLVPGIYGIYPQFSMLLLAVLFAQISISFRCCCWWWRIYGHSLCGVLILFSLLICFLWILRCWLVVLCVLEQYVVLIQLQT